MFWRVGGVAQAVEDVSWEHEAVHSNLRTEKNF
jgi:hypothetical protein